MLRIFNSENKVIHSEIATYLSELGFRYCWDTKSPYYKMLLKIEENKVYHFELDAMPHFMRKHMTEIQLNPVQIESFTRGINTYLSQSILKSVDEFETVNFRDERDSSIIYFKNCIIKIHKHGESFDILDYSEIESPIWADKVINRDFNYLKDYAEGDFENFCYKISGESDIHFKRLKSLLGYLLHNYKDPSLTKTVVFYDTENDDKDVANGGTGKTLLSMFINQFRKVSTIDGKEFNPDNRFAFQNVNVDTEVVNIDDVGKNFDFVRLFAKTTSDFQIEKKGKQIISLDYSNSPKIMITSNSLIKSPEGSSSKRRLEEFFLKSPFSDSFTPLDNYGRRFFEDWDQEEWDKTALFAIDCIKLFLEEGIVKLDELSSEEKEEIVLAKAIGDNLKQFLDDNIQSILNKEVVRSEFRQKFCDQYGDINQNRFTKHFSGYCKVKNYHYNHITKGGETYLNITSNGSL